MSKIIFSSDLHGHIDKYEKLFSFTENMKPDCLLLGGDLLPGLSIMKNQKTNDFFSDYLIPKTRQLIDKLGKSGF